MYVYFVTLFDVPKIVNVCVFKLDKSKKDNELHIITLKTMFLHLLRMPEKYANYKEYVDY